MRRRADRGPLLLLERVIERVARVGGPAGEGPFARQRLVREQGKSSQRGIEG